MFKKLSLVGASLAMGAATLVPATPAMAQSGGYYSDYDRGGYYEEQRPRRYYRGDRYRDRNYDYRGQDYSYRCKRSGTTGTIIGAIAGGLLGREVVGRRGDRTAGALVGGGIGALAGRAIEKGNNRCR